MQNAKIIQEGVYSATRTFDYEVSSYIAKTVDNPFHSKITDSVLYALPAPLNLYSPDIHVVNKKPSRNSD